jgi:hypothetical protein
MELMKSLNFAKVYDMLGGIVDWEANGYPLVIQTPPTTTPPPTTTTTPTPTTTIPIATWGELASKGSQTFSSNCAPCHGPNGEGDFGPAIIGTTLRSFGDAFRLLAYIAAWMPQDGPGSLSIGAYQRILAFMLTESGFVQPEVIFDENDIINVILTEETDM